MFGRMMNNYYYGKSGKGDFRKEDLPQNRRELFRDTLKTRLSGLCRINLLYMIIFLPAMIVLMLNFTNILSVTTNLMAIEQQESYASYAEQFKETEQEVPITEEQFAALKSEGVDYRSLLDSAILRVLIWLIPCIAIAVGGVVVSWLCSWVMYCIGDTHVKVERLEEKLIPKPAYAEYLAGSGPARGACEICGKTTDLISAKITDQLGTRYRKVCRECFAANNCSEAD